MSKAHVSAGINFTLDRFKSGNFRSKNKLTLFIFYVLYISVYAIGSPLINWFIAVNIRKFV